jgi:O-antigen/teichoic acid export membrane protein
MQEARRVAKNTVILYARMAITLFISLYSTRLILSALGVSDFGLFNLVGGVISMLGFLNSSMAASTQRFMSFAQGSGDFEKVKRIFNMSSLLHWGIAVLVFLFLEIAGYFFFNGLLKIAPERISVAKLIYQFMVISTLFTVMSVPYEAVITSHENMTVYAVLGVIEAVLKLAIALYITYSSNDHLVLYGLLMASLAVFLLLIRRIYCNRKYEECVLKPREYFDGKILKEMRIFAGYEFLVSSTSMLSFYGQTMVLNIFFGTLINAAQAIAAQISGQLGVFSTTLVKALNPLLDKSAGSGNSKLLIQTTYIGTRISFLLLSLLYIPFLIKMPNILSLWLKFVPDMTIIFCRLLLISNLIEQFSIVLNSTLGAKGDIKGYKINSSVIFIIPTTLAFILFHYNFPAYTIYVIFIFSKILILLNTLHFSILKLNISFKYFMINIFFKQTTSFILSLIITYQFSNVFKNEILNIIITFVIGCFSYLLLVWKICIDYFEKIYIYKFIKTFLSRYSW